MATYRRRHSIRFKCAERKSEFDVPEALKPYLNAELIGKHGLL